MTEMYLEQVIDATTVNKLMRKARRISRRIDKGLEPLQAGWSLDAYDPHVLFKAFPLLRMRDGFRLSSYHFCDGGNGNGFVFAIPADCELPEPPEEGFDFDREPIPEWANADIGRFLEGDGSPLSYFQASIFTRELREMGSLWHGCTWSTHKVLTDESDTAGQAWEWLEAAPREWLPAVGRDGSGLWRVSFHTHSGLDRERIVKHSDIYTAGYHFEENPREIALGEGGYVF